MENEKNFEENWPKYREKIKRQHPELTDEDLKYEPGGEKELILRLQVKLNKTKQDIRNWLHIMG